MVTNTEDREDRDWMIRLQAGDVEAFERLVEKYQSAVVAFCYRFVPDRGEAEDLAQATFVQIYRSAARFRPENRFRAWMFTIARNLCLNEIRRRRNRPSDSLERLTESDSAAVIVPFETSATAAPEALALRNELVSLVAEAMAALPENQRSALSLFQEQGLRYEEIAETLGLSVGATKSLIFRARETMRQKVKPYLETGKWDRLMEGAS